MSLASEVAPIALRFTEGITKIRSKKWLLPRKHNRLNKGQDRKKKKRSPKEESNQSYQI